MDVYIHAMFNVVSFMTPILPMTIHLAFLSCNDLLAVSFNVLILLKAL